MKKILVAAFEYGDSVAGYITHTLYTGESEVAVWRKIADKHGCGYEEWDPASTIIENIQDNNEAGIEHVCAFDVTDRGTDDLMSLVSSVIGSEMKDVDGDSSQSNSAIVGNILMAYTMGNIFVEEVQEG